MYDGLEHSMSVDWDRRRRFEFSRGQVVLFQWCAMVTMKMFKYRVQVAQNLQFEDYKKRMEFTSAFLRLTNDETFLSNIIMSGEAIFISMDMRINRSNYRLWGAGNQMIIHEQPTHAHAETDGFVWHKKWMNIIGTYFQEDDNG